MGLSVGEVFCLLVFVVSTNGLSSKEFNANVSALLTSLLDTKSYDKRIRPGLGGPPVTVYVNMYIKSLGPVNEDESMGFCCVFGYNNRSDQQKEARSWISQKYSMDIYFRQTWYDRRLAFNMTGMSEFSMSWFFLEKIWKPDTYFINGKKSHLHKITSPNKFVRVRQDGFLSSSMRLTLTASCKMYLKKFPLDSQTCPLLIGSYAYTSKDMIYHWDSSGVKLEPGVGMAQYDVINITIKDDLLAQRLSGQFSVVMTNFHLKRSTGYFLLQIYVPCCLIVCCSWVGFWIQPDAPGRTCLGATTVLSITTMGFGGRATLPKVPHATALDWFVIICFSFAFASLAEFAVISFTAKLIADLKNLKEDEEKKMAELKAEKEALTVGGSQEIQHIDDEESNLGDSMTSPRPQSRYAFLPNRWYSIPTNLAGLSLRDIPASGSAVFSLTTSSKSDSPVPWYRRVIVLPIRYYQRWKENSTGEPSVFPRAEKVVSRLDHIARFVFPVCFTVILATYFVLYTYYITDKEPEDEFIIGFSKVE